MSTRINEFLIESVSNDLQGKYGPCDVNVIVESAATLSCAEDLWRYSTLDVVVVSVKAKFHYQKETRKIILSTFSSFWTNLIIGVSTGAVDAYGESELKYKVSSM